MSGTATSNTAGTATSTATNDMHKAQAALEAAEMTIAAASQNIKSALNLTELGPNLVAKPAVVAAEASISATAESLKAVKVALEALKEAQVQQPLAKAPVSSSKGQTSEDHLEDTVSIAASSNEEDVDMYSSSSDSSWAETSSSSSSDTSRCPSVMSIASSQDFPEAPFVSYINWRGRLACSWVGGFVLHEVKEGPLKNKNVFVEQPISKPVPNCINAIRFEYPSEHMLVRVAGEEDYWVIMAGQPSCDALFEEWLKAQDYERSKEKQGRAAMAMERKIKVEEEESEGESEVESEDEDENNGQEDGKLGSAGS